MSTSATDQVVRKSILVDAAPEEAFESSPRNRHVVAVRHARDLAQRRRARCSSRARADACTSVDERPRGRLGAGTRVGTALRLVIQWSITEPATEVEIRFTAEAAGTRLELEHRGWGDEGSGNYDAGWERILGLFAERLTAG